MKNHQKDNKTTNIVRPFYKQKKFIRAIIISVLAVCSIVTIYWAAIEFYLRDFENIAYMSFSYDTSLKKGDENYGIIISKLDRASKYPKHFRIPDKVLGRPVVGIGPNAFAACDRLVSITMPKTLTSIDTQAFINCKNLANIKFSPNIDYVGVDAMQGTKWLNEIKTDTVIISEVFYAYNGVFPQGTIIKGERKPGDPAPSSTLFYINDLDAGRNINYIAQGAFRNQKGIVYFEFPDDIENVSAQILEGCSSLETVVFHDGVEVINASAFRDTTSLEEINLPDSITRIGTFAFANSALKHIEIPEGLNVLDNSIFASCTKLETVVLPEGIQKINDNVFDGCTSLRDINFPDHLDKIGIAAFRETSLKEVEIPEKVGIISESVFENCLLLEKVTLHNRITAIRKAAFRNDSKITEMILPRELKLIGQYAFEGIQIKEITIPYFVQRIEEKAFYNIATLENLTFAINQRPGRRMKPTALTFIGTSAFENCILGDDLIIPNTVATIQTRAFANSGVKNVVLPDNEGFTAIAEETFAGCYNLENIIIPKSVTNIKTKAFADCISLRTIYFGREILNLGEYIFFGCDPSLVVNCEIEIIKDGLKVKSTWDVVAIDGTDAVYATVNFGVSRP